MNVIITGASKGMGKAIADKFAANNHNVILCARNEVQLYNTMQELMTKYPFVTVKASSADLSNRTQLNDFGKWAVAELSKMRGARADVLVNNAGQFIPGSIHNEEEGVLESMIGVNLYSAYHLTRMLLPQMIAAKSGHIFNMCSIASLNAYKNGGAYSISKFALLGFSKNLREEMKDHGIKVTAVLPGAVYTDSWRESGISPQRMMESGDIADLVYAASQLSSRAVVEEIIVRPQLGDL